MSQKTEEFLKQCSENQQKLNESVGYCAPSLEALDLDDLIDTRGGSATSTTTTGAAVAAGVSAVF
ncbi:hypothetical protein [Legionella fallonii]|uniref:Uncharacterized protein n=1 Tax=Legionella fallonii LLAP-10 TaxID=1212491 RepID=A0A098FZV3_9GAMM|nr:hypothetical protein [Legionella fallonii]CEG55758.1 protein of unknown function [Legionella fallonii LLAP-10]